MGKIVPLAHLPEFSSFIYLLIISSSIYWRYFLCQVVVGTRNTIMSKIYLTSGRKHLDAKKRKYDS